MRACDAYGGNEAARQQMVKDCLDTPPELRQELTEHFRRVYEDAEEWQAERAAILEFDADLGRAEADKRAADLHAAWLVTDHAYKAHHWRCPTCIMAGQGRGPRCDVGDSRSNYFR